MGSHNSSQQSYGIVGSDQIYHFGKIKILQDITHSGQYFHQNYDFFINPQSEPSFIRNLQLQNNQCPYLVQIRSIESESVSPCSNSTRIHVTFQYFPSTLQTLLKKCHEFQQGQIIRIFTCLLEAVKHLNLHDSYHGDISPQFIYIDYKTSSEPTYKLFDSVYFKPLKNGNFIFESIGYYRAQEQKIYCSPQILANLTQKRLNPVYNQLTTDVFSIGLIILYCMTSVDPLAAYTRKNQIDGYFIQSLFRIAYRKNYSIELIDAVRQCLQQRNRPYASQVLNKYIDMFQPFLNRQFNNTTTVTKFSLRKSRKQRVFDNQLSYGTVNLRIK